MNFVLLFVLSFSGFAQPKFLKSPRAASKNIYQGQDVFIDFYDSDVLYKVANDHYTFYEDHKQAAYWWFQSSWDGHPVSLYNLAILLYEGRGVDKNTAQALELFVLSGQEGFVEAQYMAGVLYFKERELFENHLEQSFYWFHKAANLNHPEAQYNLGLMYKNGWGIQQDLELAADWFTLASKTNVKDANKQLNTVLNRIAPSE